METTITAHKLGQLLDHSFKMTIKNFGRFFLPVALYSAFSTVLLEYMFSANDEFFSAASVSPEAAGEIFGSFNGVPYFLSMFAIVLISPLFQYVVNDLAIKTFFVREAEWTLGESGKKALTRYVPMLLATLLSSLLIMAGLLAFLFGALIIALFLSLIYPVMVYEECTPRESLRRSFNLIRGEFWQITGYWIVFWLIFIGIDLVTSRIVELISGLITGDAAGMTTTIIYYILNLPVVVFTIGLQSCFTVNMYFNQRIKKEGFGLE